MTRSKSLLVIFTLIVLIAGIYFYGPKTLTINKMDHNYNNIFNQKSEIFPKRELYLIDDELLFLKRDGHSNDYLYHHALLDKQGKELCSYQDNITGPKTQCDDKSKEVMFQTIIKNLDKTDLGLAPKKVELLKKVTD